jgi:hypothetical protein
MGAGSCEKTEMPVVVLMERTAGTFPERRATCEPGDDSSIATEYIRI